jgi:hypothetical protein
MQKITQEVAMRLTVCHTVLLLGLGASAAFAQTAAPAITAMSPDRARDAYLIYSSLIPLGETAGRDWPHDLWLVRDVTLEVVPAAQPCAPTPATKEESFDMNPHFAVHPPKASMQDFQEILSDFDAHCHERSRLELGGWLLNAPVRLLNEKDQQKFAASRSTRSPDPAVEAEFKGAAALYGFSQVFFNASHTVALVYATHWCGGLCGQGFWIAFGLDGAKWKPLNWSSTSWIS